MPSSNTSLFPPHLTRPVQLALGVFCLVAVGALFFQRALQPADSVETMRGKTMGTTWKVIVVSGGNTTFPLDEIHRRIEERLEEINASMSTWLESSEISRINAETTGKWHTLSPDLFFVIKEATRIHSESDGFFDIRLGLLSRSLSFGPELEGAADTNLPSSLGYELKEGRLRRSSFSWEFDLSGIAKGYAVDELAKIIVAEGFSRFLIEIGGEIRVQGLGPRQEPWEIGIEAPVRSPVKNPALPQVLRLTQGAVATSGTYHNYRGEEEEGVHHLMDPFALSPAKSKTLSVTVQAPTCLEADAWATALAVMPHELAQKKAAKSPEIEAFFIRELEQGALQEEKR